MASMALSWPMVRLDQERRIRSSVAKVISTCKLKRVDQDRRAGLTSAHLAHSSTQASTSTALCQELSRASSTTSNRIQTKQCSVSLSVFLKSTWRRLLTYFSHPIATQAARVGEVHQPRAPALRSATPRPARLIMPLAQIFRSRRTRRQVYLFTGSLRFMSRLCNN